MKVVRLSALSNRPHLPPENISGSHFCQRLSRSHGQSAAGMIMWMKNTNHTIGNRTRDLPACSAVPQPTALPRTPIIDVTTSKFMQEEVIFCGSTAQTVRWHTITYIHTHTVGLLWTTDQPVAEATAYTTHSKRKRRTSMPSAGFKPAIPQIEWPQAYVFDRTATGIGN
jgi:hypothetical protein